MGRTPRTEQSDRDYFRRPELNTDIDPTSSSTAGYKRMMRSISVAEIDARTKEKHSEFEKPYTRGINYNELQSFHPSNWPSVAYSFPGIDPDVNPLLEVGIKKAGSCDEAWERCRQELPSSCINCGLPQLAEDCMQKQGFPFADCKIHEIFLCMLFNPLCFCEKCQGAGSVIRDNIDCDQQQDQGCLDLICSDEPCPSFELNGGDAAPTSLCPSTQICASKIEGGTPDGNKCISVPDSGCGTKNVCVTDACGNQVCKEVRMSTGVWVLDGASTFCNEGLAFSNCSFTAPIGNESCPTDVYVVSGGTMVRYMANTVIQCYVNVAPCVISKIGGCSGGCAPTGSCPDGYTKIATNSNQQDYFKWVCP